MSATDTSLRVLEWTTSDRAGRPPRGDLGAPAELARPGPDVLASIGRLVAVTSAKLRLSGPPLGDARPAGVGAALLCAAVGGRQRRSVAVRLAEAVPMPRSGADLVAHYGVSVRCAGALDAGLRELVLARSPLHALFEVPSPTEEHEVEAVLDLAIDDPPARRAAVLRLADVPATPAQGRWRGELFERFRFRDRAFVLDVYEAAMTYYGDAHRARLREAEEDGGELLVATVRWWQALASIERAHRRDLRARPAFTGYLDGIRFHWRYR